MKLITPAMPGVSGGMLKSMLLYSGSCSMYGRSWLCTDHRAYTGTPGMEYDGPFPYGNACCESW